MSLSTTSAILVTSGRSTRCNLASCISFMSITPRPLLDFTVYGPLLGLYRWQDIFTASSLLLLLLDWFFFAAGPVLRFCIFHSTTLSFLQWPIFLSRWLGCSVRMASKNMFGGDGLQCKI